MILYNLVNEIAEVDEYHPSMTSAWIALKFYGSPVAPSSYRIDEVRIINPRLKDAVCFIANGKDFVLARKQVWPNETSAILED